ncbi:MAG TPA: phage tail protein [Terriglobales bacterium]
MDANGLRFWALLRQEDWLPAKSIVNGLDYDRGNGRLRLESDRNATLPFENPARAAQLLKSPPMAKDEFGCRAWWDSSTGHVMATGALPGAVPIYTPPSGQDATDVCLGFDGILYIAVQGNVVLVDRRARWSPQTLTQSGFSFYRLAAHPQGGVWALNDTGTTMARVQGEPVADRPTVPMAPNAFDYVDQNHYPPRITATFAMPSGEQAVAIAADPQGRPGVLSWRTGQPACVRRLTDAETFTPPQLPGGLNAPYSIAFLDDHTLAVLATGAMEALVFDIGDIAVPEASTNPQPLLPSGQAYPLMDFVEGPFLHVIVPPPEYPTSSGSAPLYPLSYNTYARSAWARNQKVLDGGGAATTWHRIYIEASIPAGCGVRVLLAASDLPEQPDAKLEWHEHRFGAQYPDWEPGGEIPVAAWVPQTSEIPFHPGLLGCNEKESKGLFTALVQRSGCSIDLPDRQAGDPSTIRSGKVVRALRGRYLSVRVQLLGNSRQTPEIAALRVYASRFSYIDHYLPELYQEQVFSPDADVTGASTPADFLERLVDNFEGVLTVLEDRVASSYLVTRSETTADDSLDWLASWIGLSFDPVWPLGRRRDLLRVAPQLYRMHGTLGAMQLALDTATGGLQSEGSVVVLENYRLRRTFATILGADLEGETNPLLPGLMHSGNSFVGDTLFLGDETQKEFLSLFGPTIRLTRPEAIAVQDFYKTLAHQVTVLVHEDLDAQQLGLIQRVVDIERPAHVLVRVLSASAALLIGLASLLGIDTFLRDKPPLQPVRVDKSEIGGIDVIRHLPALDPRLEAGEAAVGYAQPIPKLVLAPEAIPGQTIILDGSGSQATPGRTIKTFRWKIEMNPS